MRIGPVEPGTRDRAIDLQQLAESSGSSRYPVESWTTLASPVWASKDDLSGREQFRANQESAKADTVWVIGYRADMDPELVDVAKSRRLSYQSRIYDIVSAGMIGRREGIELLTLAKVG